MSLRRIHSQRRCFRFPFLNLTGSCFGYESHAGVESGVLNYPASGTKLVSPPRVPPLHCPHLASLALCGRQVLKVVSTDGSSTAETGISYDVDLVTATKINLSLKLKKSWATRTGPLTMQAKPPSAVPVFLHAVQPIEFQSL